MKVWNISSSLCLCEEAFKLLFHCKFAQKRSTKSCQRGKPSLNENKFECILHFDIFPTLKRFCHFTMSWISIFKMNFTCKCFMQCSFWYVEYQMNRNELFTESSLNLKIEQQEQTVKSELHNLWDTFTLRQYVFFSIHFISSEWLTT